MKRLIWASLAVLFVVSGCTPQINEKISQLEQRIIMLEGRTESCETRLDFCEGSLVTMGQRQDAMESGSLQKQTIASAANTAVSMTAKDIQTALKNAGFYNGPVDGKIGRETEKAIIEFQKASSLKADGVVGAKTASLLLKYLSQN